MMQNINNKIGRGAMLSTWLQGVLLRRKLTPFIQFTLLLLDSYCELCIQYMNPMCANTRHICLYRKCWRKCMEVIVLPGHGKNNSICHPLVRYSPLFLNKSYVFHSPKYNVRYLRVLWGIRWPFIVVIGLNYVVV